MKAATFNANSIRSRAEVICQWLKTNQPDVLCVQETKVQDGDFPIESFANTGYQIIYKGQKKYNGVAIFSRLKPDEVEDRLEKDPLNEARFLKTSVGGWIIVNTYIPQGQEVGSEKFRYKLNWFKWLLEYFSRHFKPSDRIIWMGDLNVAIDDRDVYDPSGLWGSVCFCKEVQDGLKEVLGWGFVDLFRQFCDEQGHYTFWDYRLPNSFKRNLGWRLDYVLTTKETASLCENCRIDRQPRGAERPSDHTFVIAEFQDKPKRTSKKKA